MSIETILKVEPGEELISMMAWRGRLYVATNSRLLEVDNTDSFTLIKVLEYHFGPEATLRAIRGFMGG